MFCIIPCSPGERLKVEGGRVDIRFMTLRKLIVTAYRIKPHQLSGPDWMERQRFDITAKMPEGASRDQIPEMLQALLANRFKLSVHDENKDTQVMALVVGKNGSHLEPAAADADAVAARAASAPGGHGLYTGQGDAHEDDIGHVTVTGASYGPLQTGPPGGPSRFELLAVSMPGLVDLLAPHVGRPLIDMTELKGRYHMVFVMDLPPPPPPGTGGDGGGGRSGGPVSGGPMADPLARLSQNRGLLLHATRPTLGFDSPPSIDERSAGIQRPRSKVRTALRCSAVSSGASNTVARRPRSFVRTCTIVAATPARVFMTLMADFPVPSATRDRLASVKPITVAKVCRRNELSAHW